MKIYCIAATLLLLAGCKPDKKISNVAPVEVELPFPDHFDGAWVMSSGWMGYMGVALAVSEDRYYYWMYSDVGGAGSFPYTGTFRIEGDNLVLSSPTVLETGESADEMPEWGLYSSRWEIIRDGTSTRLHSVSDSADDHARSLYPDFGFDATTPFRNQGYMKKPNKAEMATPRKPSD